MSRSAHLSNRALLAAVGAVAAALAAWLACLPLLPAAFRAPGSPLMQSLAIAGAVLLLVPVAFALAKRTGHATGSATAWVTAHALAALAGTMMVVMHSGAHLDEPPALLLAALLALMVLGVWARVRGARSMADTFATKGAGFAPPSPQVRAELAALIAAKRELLARLDPGADEARFSPRLSHWLTRPGRTREYVRLAHREASIMGQRRSVGPGQAWWRPLHLGLAALFVGGLAVHVVVVTFFAGWVAEGREITWWHLAAW